MNFHPKNYQEQLETIERIQTDAETLERLELPEHEDISYELNTAQKEINGLGASIASVTKTLINSLVSYIDEDFSQAIANYHEYISLNGDDIVEDFPFDDWMKCAKTSYTSYAWFPSVYDVKELFNFKTVNTEIIKDNFNAFLKGIEKEQPFKVLPYMIEISTFFEGEELKKVWEDFLYPKEENESGWSNWSNYHLISVWSNDKAKTEAINKLQSYMIRIKENSPESLEEFSKKYIDVFFNSRSGNLYNFTHNNNIKEIKWATLIEFMEKSEEYDLNFSDLLLAKIDTVIKKNSYTLKNATNEQGYKDLLSVYQKNLLMKKLAPKEFVKGIKKI